MVYWGCSLDSGPHSVFFGNSNKNEKIKTPAAYYQQCPTSSSFFFFLKKRIIKKLCIFYKHGPIMETLSLTNIFGGSSNLCRFVNNERQKEKRATLLYSNRFIVCSLLRLMRIHKYHLQCKKFYYTKKWGFLLSISSVNETNSAFSCALGHIYWRYL